MESLLLPRLTPPVAPVRERRPVTAQAGDVFSFPFPIDFSLAASCVTDPQQKQRTAARNARASMSESERDHASDVIAQKVVSASWFRRAEYLACYLAAPDEVNTWEIISRAWAMKKRVFAPVIEKNRHMQFVQIREDSELMPNRFGLLEPVGGETVTARMLDVVLTPVVAFDADNQRIGMGGGYFDTTFSFLKHRAHWHHPKIVGLAFACQKVEKIEPNPWDIRLFCAVSD